MEDLNLHILFFSVLLAFAQSYIHISQPVTEEEVNCEEARSEAFSDFAWSPFENHASLPEVTKDIEPNFHLYRRGSIIDHLVVLIHGFGSKKGVWAGSMKEAIFENDPRENLAVLTVDWKKGASASFWDPRGSYNKAVANTRYIGLAAQKVVQCLQRKSKSPGNIEVHCIGHSLGAHACSFLGNAMESTTGSKMFRVTGLDPAGPQFTTTLEPGTLTTYKPLESAPRDQRLDETDAQVVDIIHTDGNQWGTMRPIGDIDFYVGKSLQTLGTHQAGCDTGDLCDHSKSIKLFSQSLETENKFKEILECQFESKLKVHNCRETETKPRFGYFYEHLPGKVGRGGIFGVLDQEADVKKLEQEWGAWGEEWDEEDSWGDEEEDKEKDKEEDKDKDEGSWEDEDEAFGVETDSQLTNSRKTTSATKVATSALDESEKAKDDVSITPTTISSNADDCLNENHLHLNTETNYHIHIGALSLSKTDMIIISLVGAVLSFSLTFLLGCYLIRFCRKAKQPSVPDASQEVLLPV